MPTYNWLLTKFAKVIATIFVISLFAVFIFSKKWDSLVIFQSLKWLRLNCENLEHPLISFDVPYNNFKADRIRLKFTKLKFTVSRKFTENFVVKPFAFLYWDLALRQVNFFHKEKKWSNFFNREIFEHQYIEHKHIFWLLRSVMLETLTHCKFQWPQKVCTVKPLLAIQLLNSLYHKVW